MKWKPRLVTRDAGRFQLDRDGIRLERVIGGNRTRPHLSSVSKKDLVYQTAPQIYSALTRPLIMKRIVHFLQLLSVVLLFGGLSISGAFAAAPQKQMPPPTGATGQPDPLARPVRGGLRDQPARPARAV